MGSDGIVKATIEHYIELFRRERDISSLLIRPSNPYGPRQGHISVQGVVATFLNLFLAKEVLHICGDVSVVRDYIFVEDLPELCVRAGSSRRDGVFNDGSGIGVIVNGIVAEISRATGHIVVSEYSRGRAVDVPRSVLDMSRVKETFGWQPAISLQSGIATTWSWLTSVQE